LGFDQADNIPLLNLFGLASAEDGGTNPIDNLEGQTDALTNEILFTGNSQTANSYIDKYVPSANAIAAFIESNYATVAVQQSVPNDRKTFCFSYSLADLTDGEFPNTREELLHRIFNFFDIYTAAPVLVESNKMSCKVYPNPASTETTIQYYLPDESHVTVEIFNSTGQKIRQPFNDIQSKGNHSIQWKTDEMPTGIYFYSLRTSTQTQSGKLIIRK
jgi:hypothetical protein